MDRSTNRTERIIGGMHVERPHDSARKHVTGEAVYTDDINPPHGMLYAALGTSEHAHARVHHVDLRPVLEFPGVVAVVSAQDIPGTNNIGPVVHDEPLFATDEVAYAGQPLFAVAAEDIEIARRAVRRAVIRYEPLDSLLTIEEALERQSFVLPPYHMRRGDSARALSTAPHRLAGRLMTGGQDHFYLEGQIAVAIPQEDGDMLVHSSTQHPSEIQHTVANVLGLRANAVTVDVRRLGGAFGGKETQAALPACVAALLAQKTGCPVNLRMDRDDDMIITGKRHDFLIEYDVGFDDEGRIRGIDFTLASRCGMSADLSGPVNDRAVFHVDNAYYLDSVSITSYRCKTNTVSSTAMRGFGAPQAMMGIEHVVDEIARYLRKDPLDVRRVNFYGVGERDLTPYDMKVEDNVINELVTELAGESDYATRRTAIHRFNASSPVLRRGIALTPVKFGISFTSASLNQAGALVHVYTDGSVHLNHGGIEMGQGLHTNVAQIVAEEFQIDVDRVKVTATNTGKVPNTSATAASSGTDLNGKAAQAAARTIKERLTEFAARHCEVDSSAVQFERNHIRVGEQRWAFEELVRLAYLSRVPLSATGFYRTPKIHYDREKGRGRPFYYFAYGAAVAEVVIDTLTGEYKVLRIDILHDAGNPINPAIALGQVEGGFVQGMGWLTSEELHWDVGGQLQTHSPSTYKIPTCGDVPADFRVRLWAAGSNREDVIGHAKAVGEPPFMLAISVFHAIKDAIASLSAHELSPQLHAPATAERVLLAIEDLKSRLPNHAPVVATSKA